MRRSGPATHKNSRRAIVIAAHLLCVPPTLVGGQRPRMLFLEPGSAGLLEESRSPAEAGSRVIYRSSDHQLKLVANGKSCLWVSRFMRNLVDRGAHRGRRDVTKRGLASPMRDRLGIRTVNATPLRDRPQLPCQQHSALSAFSAVMKYSDERERIRSAGACTNRRFVGCCCIDDAR